MCQLSAETDNDLTDDDKSADGKIGGIAQESPNLGLILSVPDSFLGSI